MPSKKPNKAAKKPGKAIPKKAAVRKSGSCQKGSASVTRPHIEGNSETAQTDHEIVLGQTRPKHDTPSNAAPAPSQTARARCPRKPAVAVTNEPAASAERAPPTVKFDPRPLVMPTRAAPSDDDGDNEPIRLRESCWRDRAT